MTEAELKRLREEFEQEETELKCRKRQFEATRPGNSTLNNGNVTINVDPIDRFYAPAKDFASTIPIFSGDGETTYERFDRAVTQQLHLVPANNQELYVGHLVSRLRGRAR